MGFNSAFKELMFDLLVSTVLISMCVNAVLESIFFFSDVFVSGAVLP